MTSEFHKLALEVGAEALIDHLGESVAVRIVGLPGRTVSAIVDRDPFVDAPESPFGGSRRQPIHVKMKNSESFGMTPTQASEETTTIEVAGILGDANSCRQRPITRIVNQDGGMVVVEVNL